MITKRKLRQSIMFILKKNEAELGFTLIEVLVSTLIVGMIPVSYTHLTLPTTD